MPAKTRARVLRAASRSFLRHGYHTSVEEIARRAGVAKQTLYHHFPSKDQRSEEHTSELQSQSNLVCRLLLEKKNFINTMKNINNTRSRISDDIRSILCR